MRYYKSVKPFRFTKSLTGLFLSLVLMFAGVVTMVSASHVAPVFVSGNNTCSALVPGTTELKVEPVANGVYSDGTLSVTISNYASGTFDFSANMSLDAVFVKAGSGGNLYAYNPESSSDTGLVTPEGKGASHISFCYDVEPPTPTPTRTPTPTVTPTPTNTPTPTPTNTPTPTPTNTPTPTPTNTPTPTPTNTPTSTPTKTPTPTPTPTPPPITFEACTPGYWKVQPHLDSWPATGYSPNQTLESVFDVPDIYGLDNYTLLQALSFQGGKTTTDAAKILLRASVASLLNASHPTVEYPLTTAEVISQVNSSLATFNRSFIISKANQLDGYNNLYACPLN